jgi:predicted nucleic acid-binding protein
MTVIGDTGFIIAVATTSDEAHKACVDIYNQQTDIYLP